MHEPRPPDPAMIETDHLLCSAGSERKDAGAVQIRVRTQTGARVLMYASPAMRCGTIKDRVWAKKGFAKDKINDFAVKLFNADLLMDDTQSLYGN